MSEEFRSVDVESSPTVHPNRWLEVKAIFELALTLDASEWSDFLRMRCRNDSELMAEVRSLLAAHDSSSGFLETPIASLKEATAAAGPVAARPEMALIGSRIGAYSIEREIGTGGMGAVFLANRADDEFEQRVAIKLIRSEKVTDSAVRRFRQERQILAQLEHPFIARLIDGGTTEAGMPYLVMEFVEGQTLTQYCDARNLTTRERLELFLRICLAVQYAHERQIIHRDLKPGNILVKDNGTPKLLDFGIAKMLQPEDMAGSGEATAVGLQILTPAYASPEQMRGDPATACSDIYSLGVVLYELLCGERPSLSAVQQKNATPTEKEGHFSRNLRAIIYRAIHIAPEDRYGSVALFAEDLTRYLSGLPTRASLPEAEHSWTEKISVAVLPFRDTGQESGSSSFLKTAITDALVMRLSKVDRLSVRPTSAVLRYGSSPDTGRAARELRVKYLLEGSWDFAGDLLRVKVQLVSSESGLTVWAASFQEQVSDLLSLEDSISEQIALALIPQLTSEERQQLSDAGTDNEQAHQAYLRGRYHWSRSAGEPEELTKALVYFSEAIAADPQYARAHAGIADYHLRLGLWGGLPPAESFAAGLQAAETALAIDPLLAEAHASLGFCLWAYHRDYVGAEREFQLAIARNPDYASAHHWFGLLNSARGRPQLALANLERARKVDPSSPLIAAALGFVHYTARDYTKALDLLLDAARELRYSAVLHELLAWCYLQLKLPEKALQHATQAVETSERNPQSLAVLARAHGKTRNFAAAREVCAELATLSRSRFISGYDTASALLGIEDINGALASLQRCFEQHDWWLCWIAVDPRLDPLRLEPQFQELVRKVHPPEPSDTLPTAQAPARPQGMLNPKALSIALAGLLLLFLAAALWMGRPQVSWPFQHPKFYKLTGDGTAQSAAISPDGKTVVYTTSDTGRTRIWRRTTQAAGPPRLLSEMPGDITALDFTRNGRYLAFQNYPGLQPLRRHLYVLPVAGGKPQPLLRELSGPASVSYDGLFAAYVRTNRGRERDEIVVADLQRGTERVVAQCRFPNRISNIAPPAWSLGGESVAFAVEQRDEKGFFIGIDMLTLGKKEPRHLVAPRWLAVQHLAFTNGNAGLAVVGREQNSSFQQIWYVPRFGGPAQRLGNDVDSYVGASLSTDASELVSVQRQTLAHISYLTLSSLKQHTQVTPGAGRYFDLSWTPNGRLLYASDATGSADIWSMDIDGSNQRQLTSGEGLNWAPAASPDGKLIAFHANPKGTWQIWTAQPDGTGARQLTYGTLDSNWPQFTPDGRSIVYHKVDTRGLWSIWSVPAAGGTPVQLTARLTMHPVVNPKDGRLAAWYAADSEKPHWQLAVFGPEGGLPVQVIEPGMPIAFESQLGWNPAGDSITFLSQRKGVWNLWMQPLDGRPAWPLTSFTSGQIYSFSWSKDGRLAFSQGSTTTDVVRVRSTDAR